MLNFLTTPQKIALVLFVCAIGMVSLLSNTVQGALWNLPEDTKTEANATIQPALVGGLFIVCGLAGISCYVALRQKSRQVQAKRRAGTSRESAGRLIAKH